MKTNFQSGFPDDGTREALENMPCLYPPDIAEAVVYTLSTPPHVQVKLDNCLLFLFLM